MDNEPLLHLGTTEYEDDDGKERHGNKGDFILLIEDFVDEFTFEGDTFESEEVHYRLFKTSEVSFKQIRKWKNNSKYTVKIYEFSEIFEWLQSLEKASGRELRLT